MTAASALVSKRVVPTTCERLFDMWTSAERLKQWFAPGEDMSIPVAEVEAREGGSCRIVEMVCGGNVCRYSPVRSRRELNPLRTGAG